METINFTIKTDASASAKERAKFIANEMFRQLQCPNFQVFYSAGCKCFDYCVNQEDEPFLKFKVNGAKFKGYVFVVYDFSDTYKIAFVDKKGVAVKEVFDVYCDELQNSIDEFVEKLPEYKY